MAKVLTPDICVIGGGPGGLAVATGAATYGIKVVLVDKGLPPMTQMSGVSAFAMNAFTPEPDVFAAKRRRVRTPVNPYLPYNRGEHRDKRQCQQGDGNLGVTYPGRPLCRLAAGAALPVDSANLCSL